MGGERAPYEPYNALLGAAKKNLSLWIIGRGEKKTSLAPLIHLRSIVVFTYWIRN
jgi:hypothetical protein